MKITTHKLPVFLILCSIAALSACNKNTDDLNQFIEDTKAKHVGSVKPIPQFKPYESFVYSAMDLRDPFTPNEEIDDARATDGPQPVSTRPKEELESYPLDTLSMVGTLEQNEEVWALIQDPKNTVHRVQPGQYMGQNEGKISSITETDINLVEIVTDGLGGYLERNASLTIGNE